jgi:hypothetical protein
MKLLYRNLRIAAAFWLLCLILFSIERVFGSQVLSGLVFLLSIPALAGALAWINRPLLQAFPEPPKAFLLYGGIVLLNAVIIVALGLLAGVRLPELFDANP